MTEKGDGGRKWFKYGCFGCLGCFGVIIIISLLGSGVVWFQSRSARTEDQVLTREIPGTAAAGEEIAPDGEIPGGERKRLDLDVTAESPGRVFLDLRQADFRIVPNRPGEPIRVEATFDPADYALEEIFEEGGEAGWTYTVKFRQKTAGSFLTTLKEMFAGTSPNVKIFLPVDHPLILDLDVRQGGAVLEVDEMWLTSADLKCEMGGLVVTFDRPLRAPMDSLSVRSSMGGCVVSGAGNASPRRMVVDARMGGLDLDLKGAWVQDSEITISQSMGGGAVHLPDNVLFEGIDAGSFRPPAEQEVPTPTLRFSASSEMGNLEFFD